MVDNLNVFFPAVCKRIYNMRMCFVNFQEKNKVDSSLKLFGSQNLKTEYFGGPESCITQLWKCCSNEFYTALQHMKTIVHTLRNQE